MRSSSQAETIRGLAEEEPGAGGSRDVNTESDDRLMLAYAAGSAEAFAELFRRYRQHIFGFCRRRVVDAAQAEELTQECFLAVIRGAAGYRPEALFRTYLYAIALKMVQAYRRKAIFRGMFVGVADGGLEPAEANHLDAEITLRQAMGRLDRVDREVLMLREYEELSYAEIAGLLAIPLNTVRSRLFRARMALREILVARTSEDMSTGLKQSEERI